MKTLNGRVESVHVGNEGRLSKEKRTSIEMALDGIVGDRHRSFERETWASGDKQPAGVRRRNERHWSAVSLEELALISEEMNLAELLTAETLGANLCVSGVPELSRLPKGSILKFPSGAELVVEEYNPPCKDMGESIAAAYRTKDGDAPSWSAFPQAAKLLRGVVGVVEVAGVITAGDAVMVSVYETPEWLRRSD
ncbi:MAG: MOSC domain-containing protein [Pseudomonadota bacterium]